MIYKKRSITCYCIFQKNLLPLQAIIHSNQKKMTDILVLTLTLLIAWGAYTLVGKNSNEKSKGILSLAYIFCIMTAMEYSPSSSITHWIDSADYPVEYVWQLHLQPPS